MLVLSRRKGQRILIGDGIEVVVTECHRSSVKLAVIAPAGMFVRRAELDVIEESEPVEPSRRPCGVMQPAGEASPARTGVAPGTDRGEPPSYCVTCYGTGCVGQPIFPERCPACGGTGQAPAVNLPHTCWRDPAPEFCKACQARDVIEASTPSGHDDLIVTSPEGCLPAGDTGTVSPPRSSVSPDPKGGAVLGEEGGSHPGLERALDLFDALVSARKRGE